MATLVFVPNASPSASGGRLIPLDQIPDEVKSDAEQVYKALKDAPVDGRMHVEMPSAGELQTYLAQIDSYCKQRPEELGGPIHYRKSPARKLPPTAAEFRIVDKTDNEEKTEEIRKAVDNVKVAAKK